MKASRVRTSAFPIIPVSGNFETPTARRSILDERIYHSLRKRSESVSIITCPNSRFFVQVDPTALVNTRRRLFNQFGGRHAHWLPRCSLRRNLAHRLAESVGHSSVSSFKACKFKVVKRIFAPSPSGGNGLVRTKARLVIEAPQAVKGKGAGRAPPALSLIT